MVVFKLWKCKSLWILLWEKLIFSVPKSEKIQPPKRVFLLLWLLPEFSQLSSPFKWWWQQNQWQMQSHWRFSLPWSEHCTISANQWWDPFFKSFGRKIIDLIILRIFQNYPEYYRRKSTGQHCSYPNKYPLLTLGKKFLYKQMTKNLSTTSNTFPPSTFLPSI